MKLGISEDGHIYPCRYLRNAPIGTIDKPVDLHFIEYSVTKHFHMCENCNFLKVCGRLCIALHQKGFSKICNFYKKYLIDYISAIPIKAIKELHYAQEKYKEEKPRTSSLVEEEIKRFTRRILCPIGIF